MTQRKFHFTSALTSSGWQKDVSVAVDQNGMIENVEAGVKGGTLITGIAIPAVANVHSHAHQRLMVGLAERAGPGADSFWTWREAMYGFALKLSPDDLEAVAAQAYVEMVKAAFPAWESSSICTTSPMGSPMTSPLKCPCAASRRRSRRALPLPCCRRSIIMPDLAASRDAGQRRFINDADRFLEIYGTLKAVCGTNPLRRLGISPHSLRAVTPELLKTVLNGIEDAARVHIHVAEQTKEVDDCLAWSWQAAGRISARPV